MKKMKIPGIEPVLDEVGRINVEVFTDIVQDCADRISCAVIFAALLRHKDPASSDYGELIEQSEQTYTRLRNWFWKCELQRDREAENQ